MASTYDLYKLTSLCVCVCVCVAGVEAEYEAWTKQFDVQSHQSEISQLLVNCPHIRTLHGQLVPAKASYESFWHRYFFKLGLLQQVM